MHLSIADLLLRDANHSPFPTCTTASAFRFVEHCNDDFLSCDVFVEVFLLPAQTDTIFGRIALEKESHVRFAGDSPSRDGFRTGYETYASSASKQKIVGSPHLRSLPRPSEIQCEHPHRCARPLPSSGIAELTAQRSPYSRHCGSSEICQARALSCMANLRSKARLRPTAIATTCRAICQVGSSRSLRLRLEVQDLVRCPYVKWMCVPDRSVL